MGKKKADQTADQRVTPEDRKKDVTWNPSDYDRTFLQSLNVSPD